MSKPQPDSSDCPFVRSGPTRRVRAFDTETGKIETFIVWTPGDTFDDLDPPVDTPPAPASSAG